MTLATSHCIIRYKLNCWGVKTIFNQFKALRISAGLTQKELADKLGVSQVSVWQWESGDNLPRADKLPAIAAALGCTVNDLLEPKEA